ncbi:hypothetical protein R3P38DRAFT_3349920 [Favolaschia claudopus]|uniref:F5/8 type C domain-containing protein n=1 Tax=Favolaschia claudopus TaxID=2862362 RepID=A0AAW0CLH5_9AGAR
MAGMWYGAADDDVDWLAVDVGGDGEGYGVASLRLGGESMKIHARTCVDLTAVWGEVERGCWVGWGSGMVAIGEPRDAFLAHAGRSLTTRWGRDMRDLTGECLVPGEGADAGPRGAHADDAKHDTSPQLCVAAGGARVLTAHRCTGSAGQVERPTAAVSDRTFVERAAWTRESGAVGIKPYGGTGTKGVLRRCVFHGHTPRPPSPPKSSSSTMVASWRKQSAGRLFRELIVSYRQGRRGTAGVGRSRDTHCAEEACNLYMLPSYRRRFGALGLAADLAASFPPRIRDSLGRR